MERELWKPTIRCHADVGIRHTSAPYGPGVPHLTRKQFLHRGALTAGAAMFGGTAPAFAAADPLGGDLLHRDVRDLCAFGPRRTGTDAEHGASAWVAERLRAAGLEVRLDPYPFRQWRLTGWDVELVAGTASAEVAAFPRTVATHPIWNTRPAAGEADLVYVGSGTQKELDRHDLRGKAVLVDGKVLLNVFATYNADGYVYWNAAARGAVAMFATSDAPGNLVRMIGMGRNELDANPIPAFTVGRKDFGMMRRASHAGTARIRYRLDATHVDGVTHDVVATLPGSRTDKDGIVACAHTDSMFDGALDDATGIAGLIGLAHHFAARPRHRRPKPMTFLAVTGHDTGFPHLGVRHWIEANAAQVAKLSGFCSLDHLAGIAAEDLGGDRPVRRGGDEERLLLISDNALLYGLTAQVAVKHRLFPSIPAPEPLARANPDLEGMFVERGVPSVNMTMAYPWYHTPQDTPDKIPPTQLARSTRAYRDILESMQRMPSGWLRRAETSPRKR